MAEPLSGAIGIEGPSEAPSVDLGTVDGLFSPGRRGLTSGLVATITLMAFEALAVATIMPIVAADLGGIELYGWVFSAFFLGSLIGIVVVGGLIDRGGLARPYAVGLGLFCTGLVIGGLAPSMGVLVAGRFLQGLGFGAIPPTAYVSIGRALPENLRPRMFAILSTAWVVPGIIGPAAAGALAEATTWRAVFLGLLPLIAIAGAITLPALRASDKSADDGSSPRPIEPGERGPTATRLPLALLVSSGAALVVAGLTVGVSAVGGLLIVAGLGLVVPAFRRLTPPGTLRAARGLPAAILLRGLLTFSFFAADAYVPLALQTWRGLSATLAGLALTGATLSWTAGAWIQARRFELWGARRLVRSGFILVVLGVAGFALILVPTVPPAIGIATWTLAGLGMGLSYSPLSLTVLREAPGDSQGEATSGLQLSDVLGTALGTGIGGAIIAFGVRNGLEPWIGLLGAFGIGAAVGLLGAALANRLPGRRRAFEDNGYP